MVGANEEPKTVGGPHVRSSSRVQQSRRRKEPKRSDQRRRRRIPKGYKTHTEETDTHEADRHGEAEATVSRNFFNRNSDPATI